MAEVKKSSLQSRLSVVLPDLPGFSAQWQLKEYNDNLVIFLRKLLDYLRRKDSQLTGPNIYNEIIEQVVNFDELIERIGGLTQGFGPLDLELYADASWVNSASAFSGTKYGTLKVPTTNLSRMEFGFVIGDNTGGGVNVRAVKLLGKFIPNFTGDYDLEIIHDDGVRLYINGVLKIDQWGGSGTHLVTDGGAPALSLTAGTAVSFRVEAINAGGTDFSLKMRWANASETGGIGTFLDIPYSALRAP